jgi:predicted mannosyl-3-phosphoglycerate phosphatase (HAD superfamily)
MHSVTDTFHDLHRVVFSDVDGTLLDERGDIPRAWPEIQRSLADSLLVLASSFIAENGAILVLTNEWLQHPQGTVLSYGRRTLRLLPIGTPRTHLTSIVRGAAQASRVVIETHRDQVTADINRAGVSSGSVASHALGRAHSLLLRISGAPEDRLRFFSALTAAGLTVSHGGRWHVVQGKSSKGIATRALMGIIRQRVRHELCVVGVGDAQNDRSMLEAADLRFVMRRPDGTVERELSKLDDAQIAETPGIEGWNEILPRLQPLSTHGRAS